jgi:hypothetical protein
LGLFFFLSGTDFGPGALHFVPGNDSAACNILLDFSFGFSRLSHRPGFGPMPVTASFGFLLRCCDFLCLPKQVTPKRASVLILVLRPGSVFGRLLFPVSPEYSSAILFVFIKCSTKCL